jgi:hypothetical protein
MPAPLPRLSPIETEGRFEADPHADAAIASIMGDWPDAQPLAASPASAQDRATTMAAQWESHWLRLKEVTHDFSRWDSNRAVQHWSAPQRGMIEPVESALANYLTAARGMPEWADAKKIARAEEIFMDNGVLSVMLLFCSSLPECYVLPDLSTVLQATGELVDHADHRIRQTGAMIFPVMNEGGLCTEQGLGIAQVLKVRLIHATIRNLILRQAPEAALMQYQSAPNDANAGIVPAIAELENAQNLHHKLFGMGWNIPECGLPCNQEELAYTLLTFNYVYLRSLRVLGIGYGSADEEAFLHAWNVAAHFLGVDKRYMVWTMDDAKAMFDDLQAKGRARIAQRKARNPQETDPRPALGQALMAAMESVIDFGLLRPFPNLLTIELCGKQTARDLGIDRRASWSSELVFFILMIKIRVFDWTVRLFAPNFSIARWIGKMMGAPLTYKLMMAQTRSLKLPTHLRSHIEGVLQRWAAS